MGKVIMSGIVPQVVAPVSGTPLSEIAVGSIVKLNENGSPVDYIVVNQGIPSNSSLYDNSCDGTWLLRKDVCADPQTWYSPNYTRSYSASSIHSYVNSTFLGLFDSDTQAAIIQAKIPHIDGTGANGLSTKVFLLSAREAGADTSIYSEMPYDGATLSYFSNLTNNNFRIAYRKAGEAYAWWLRSPETYISATWFISQYGSFNSESGAYAKGVRPTLILPHTVLVKDDGTIKV